MNMSKLQQIFNQYYPSYLDKYWAKMPKLHRKVADDIQLCQTGRFGKTKITCSNCHHDHSVMTGCGNRHCSGCQMSKGIEWAQKQSKKLLPRVKYFMVTFTIPEEVRECFKSNQRFCYDALFKAGSATIQTLTSDKENLGVDKLGYFGVFHAGGRTMNYHPHVHFIISNGGMSDDYSRWQRGRDDFIFDHKKASKLFRGKMMSLLEGLIPMYPALDGCRHKGWNVNIEQKGDGKNSLNYLSRYLFKSVIAESNLLSWDDGKVTFQYTPKDPKKKRNGEYKDKQKKKKMTLPAEEFLRRFLSLTLPHGFMKVRHYGFLSSNPKLSIEEIADLIFEGLSSLFVEDQKEEPLTATYLRCIKCKSRNVQMVYSPPPKRSVIKKE